MSKGTPSRDKMRGELRSRSSSYRKNYRKELKIVWVERGLRNCRKSWSLLLFQKLSDCTKERLGKISMKNSRSPKCLSCLE
jgi:hypothetical protein